MRTSLLLAIALAAACDGSKSPPVTVDAAQTPGDGAPTDTPPAASNFSFFVTSIGNPKAGDFRRTAADSDGLAGADEFCRMLAAQGVPASATKQWRAYLSTSTVNAKDRIGDGPWYNHAGVMIAASIPELLEPATNKISKATALTETGATVPGRGDRPNQHDIVTGTKADGTADAHCNSWTSSSTGTATVGHSDRMGLDTMPPALSWSSSHASGDCSADGLARGGGRGSIYCFAAD